MQLVDKENHVARGADFAHQVFEPLFKLAAKLGARHQRAHVQRNQPLADQRFRDGSGDHALRQPFGHGGLANAGLADQHGVVLGAAGENLHDALDFLFAPDHRIQFALLGAAGQIGAVFGQRAAGAALGAFISGGRGGAAHGLARHLAQHALAQLLPVAAGGGEDARGHALAFAQQRQPDVRAGDVRMPQPLRLAHAAFQQLLGARGQLQRRLQTRALADEDADGRAHGLLRHAFGQIRHVVARLGHQGQQQMLGADIGMAHGLRLFLRNG